MSDMYGQEITKIQTDAGDTMLDIATVYSLSPAYAEALITYNALPANTKTTDALPATVIAIPDNWLKPEILGSGSLVINVDGVKKAPLVKDRTALYVIAGVLFIALAMSSK